MKLAFRPLRLEPTRVLLLLILALAAGLAWMWVDRTGKVRNVTWTSPEAVHPDIKLPATVNLTKIQESTSSDAILQRPIFAPDRRPPPPPPPPVAPPPPDPLADIKIQGVFVGQNAGFLARIDGKSRRIKLNESIGPWTLKNIQGRDINFAQGEVIRTLRLEYAKLNGPVPAPVATNVPGTQGPPPVPASIANLPGKQQDEMRERLKRRNELRASRGLPPVND
jgi:hypothetical protein